MTTEQPAPTADFSTLPQPGEPKAWAPPAITTWKLSNGVKVWYLQQGPAPLVSMYLVVPGGASTDPANKAGLTALVADLMDEGAGGKSALEIGESWERLATDYGISPGTDAVLFHLNMLADKVAPSLELFADVLQRPAFDAKEFQRRKDQALARALADEDRAGTAKTLALRTALFGKGYGAWPPSGTRATLKNITLWDVKSHFPKVIQPDGASVVVVGGIERSEIEPLLEQALGSWKAPGGAKSAALEPSPSKRAVYLVDFPKAPQSSVSIARRSPGTDADDLFPSMQLNRVLGGAFSSRLNLNLREDKGYTYGARSGFNRWRRSGFFSLSADVKTEVTGPAIGEMLDELGALCGSRPITEEERSEAVGGLLMGFPGRFETISGVASQLAQLPMNGWPEDWFEKWPARVRSVTLGEINAAAKRYCSKDDFVVVVAGDRAVVEPQLTTLTDLQIVHVGRAGKKR